MGDDFICARYVSPRFYSKTKAYLAKYLAGRRRFTERERERKRVHDEGVKNKGSHDKGRNILIETMN